MIRNSIQWLMRLGTPSVIDEVVSLVFSHARCVEWFDYEPVLGTPYHFKVVIDDAQFDNEQVNRLIALVMELKNVRSFFDGIERLTTINNPIYMGLAVGRSRNQVTWIQ
jgi:P2-related tail formation protein